MTTLESAVSTERLPGAAGATVLRSHYHDAALHRAVTETGRFDGRALLADAASLAVRNALLDETLGGGVEERIRSILSLTRLGRVVRIDRDDSLLRVEVAGSGTVAARREMFGKPTGPVCDITRGVLAGVVSSVEGRAFAFEEEACSAVQGDLCTFVGTPDGARLETDPLPSFAAPVSSIDTFDGGLPGDVVAPLLADGPEGIPGASYGLLWSELYARAAREFEEAVPREMGSKFANLPSVVLTEAAHLGTFYSIGGLIRSERWQAEVAPRLGSRAEWVQALVELINGFGWGSWRIQLLAPEQRFTVQVRDGFEALSRVALAGGTDEPRCYFARGVVAALMNVLYGGDVLGPESLSQSVYNDLFRSPLSFRAIETRCQSMGDQFCEFVANPLSPGIRRG